VATEPSKSPSSLPDNSSTSADTPSLRPATQNDSAADEKRDGDARVPGTADTEKAGAGGAGGAAGGKPPPRSPITRRAAVVRQVFVGLVILAVLFGLQILVEGAPFVDSTRLWTFSHLQAILPETTPDRLSVVVLDSTKIPGGTLAHPKDRDELRRVIDDLKLVGATAVGIDVDMAPTVSGWASEKDPAFFSHCLEVSEKMPVFLGVSRGRENGSDHWLNMPEFTSLAAYIGAARSEDGIRFTRAQEHYEDSHGGRVLPSMAYALAQAWYKKHPDRTLPVPGPFLSEITEPLDEDKFGRLINFSKVGQLNREFMEGTGPNVIVGEPGRYRGKIVILGRAQPVKEGAMDAFIAPGWGWQPGVLYHASSAWTFGFEPVYEFNRTGRNVLDLMLGGVFLLAVGLRAHYTYEVADEKKGVWKFVEQYALLIAFLLVVVLAFVFMRFFQIMWLDALWVGIGLLLHYIIPQQVKEFWPKLMGENK